MKRETGHIILKKIMPMCSLKPNDSEKEMLISDIVLETFNIDIDMLLYFEASCSPNKFVEQEYL